MTPDDHVLLNKRVNRANELADIIERLKELIQKMKLDRNLFIEFKLGSLNLIPILNSFVRDVDSKIMDAILDMSTKTLIDFEEEYKKL